MHPALFVAFCRSKAISGKIISVGFIHPTRMPHIIVALPRLKKEIFLGNPIRYNVSESYLIFDMLLLHNLAFQWVRSIKTVMLYTNIGVSR